MVPPGYRLAMTIFSLALAFAAVCASSCALAQTLTTPPSNPAPLKWGEVSGGLQSRIWADQPAFGPTNAILIHYAIRNASEVSQKVWHDGFWTSNQVEIMASDGKPVPLTVVGEANKKSFGGPAEKSFAVSLKPGLIDESFTPLNLRQFFVFKAPGNYTVQYSYKLENGSLFTNHLQIIINEK